MYLGSAVPHITKDGLQGIQEPLRDLYPEQGLIASGTSGIDSWLSVWSNGILVENVDDHGNEVKRFHPIESLHYCAAVRFVSVPRGHNGSNTNTNTNTNSNTNSNTNIANSSPSSSSISEKVAKFLPLDSPFSRYANTSHPPLFACILRRTTGIKVLECHAFICKKEAAANALVRCCFHAYADTIHAKQIDNESPYEQLDRRRSRSISALDTVEKVEEWRNRSTNDSSHEEIQESNPGPNGSLMNGHSMTNGNSSRPRTPSATSVISHSHDEENYKVWTGSAPLEREIVYLDGSATLRSMRSTANSIASANMKTPKPRQIAIPCTVPPPPLPPPLTLMKNKKSKKKESTLKKKHKYKGVLEPQHSLPAPHIIANSYPINMLTPVSLSAHPPHHLHPSHAIYAPSSIYSDGRRLMPRRPPVPPPQLNHHNFIQDGYPQHSIILGPNEEPIYIPAMRPITPLSNYHPLHGEQHMIVQQYGQQYGQQYPPSVLHYATTQRSVSQRDNVEDRKHKKDRKKSSQSEESPFNTGIYKKKGHLNERAFSYSIRQEHRSRSNSLSNLHFDEHNGDSMLTNGDSVHIINDNYNSNHSKATSRNGSALTERELSERLTALKINGNGMPPPPPPPPPNGLIDQPKTATIKRSLHSKF
jgi:hypothetical protein